MCWRAICGILIFAAVGCGPPEVCRLAITSPGDGTIVGPRDDVSNALPGIQVNVTVAAAGLRDGSPVTLTSSSGASATANVAGGQVVFSAFTLTPDAARRAQLEASATACIGPPVTVRIPDVTLLIAFTNPSPGFRFRAADNRNPEPKDLSFIRDVEVVTNAPPDSQVSLVVSGHPQPPERVSAGEVSWKGVVLPPSRSDGPDVVLVATVSDPLGNSALAQVSGRVEVTSPVCDLLGLSPGLATVKGFATPVLNAAHDLAPKSPGGQSNVIATAEGGATVTLLVDRGERTTATAGALGPLTFDEVTFGEGERVLQTRCATKAGTVHSPRLALFVDSLPPTCRLIAPTAGRNFGPVDDVESQLAGVQLQAILTTTSADAEGQPAVFGVNGVDQGAPEAVLTDGRASHLVTLATPGMGTNTITASLADRAANSCVASAEVGLDQLGCALVFISPQPTAPPRHPVVRVDDDTSPAGQDGLQYDVSLAVDRRCIGRQVRLSIDGRVLGEAPVVRDAGQRLGARVDFPSALLCPPGPGRTPPSCDAVYHLFAALTNAGGVPTSASLGVLITTVPPSVLLQPQNPKLRCGGAFRVADGLDVDGATPGVQLVMAATTSARLVDVRVTNGMSDATFSPQLLGSKLSTVTLPEGVNSVVARAVDDGGSEGRSQPCVLTVNGLEVLFASPGPGGVIKANGGSVTGTVSIPGASVTLFIDGAQVAAQTAGDRRWSFDGLMLAAGSAHLLRVDASAGGTAGSAQINVIADGTGPTTINSLRVDGTTRNRVSLSFVAPGDDNPPVASYQLRWANQAITPAGFTVATTAPAPPPVAPGARQSVEVGPVYPGVPTWLAIASLDRVGNRSEVSNVITAAPTYSRRVVGPPADAGEQSALREFGRSAVGADFDGDGQADLAVGAPLASYNGAASREGAVYVWFGGGNGVGGVADLVLRGHWSGGRVGTSLAAGDVNRDGRADLLIGAPGLAAADRRGTLVTVGGAYLVLGGVGLGRAMAPRTLDVAASTLVIGDPDDPSLVDGAVGAAVALGRFDEDQAVDLVLGAPGVAAGAGGAFVIFGGPLGGTIRVPTDLLDQRIPGARLACDSIAAARGFGELVAAVGPLRGPGDTAGEVIVGSAAIDRAVVFGGPPGLVDLDGATSSLAVLRGSAAGGLGGAVVRSEDSDGNGFAELLLGEPAAALGAGRVWLLDGSKLPGGGRLVDPTVEGRLVVAGSGGEGLGSSLGLADLSGDGHPDVIAGGAGGSGRWRPLYGPLPYGQASPTALFSATVGAVAARRAVVPGDLDQDGLPDLLLLDPSFAGGAGRLEVFY